MKIGHGRAYDTSNSTATYSVPVPMRANPTGSISSASDVGVAGLSAGGTTSVSVALKHMMISATLPLMLQEVVLILLLVIFFK